MSRRILNLQGKHPDKDMGRDVILKVNAFIGPSTVRYSPRWIDLQIDKVGITLNPHQVRKLALTLLDRLNDDVDQPDVGETIENL
jgi:hypothetical protein